MLRIAKEALTFDDVLSFPLILPFCRILPISGTQLTKTIRLNIPVLSVMDTV